MHIKWTSLQNIIKWTSLQDQSILNISAVDHISKIFERCSILNKNNFLTNFQTIFRERSQMFHVKTINVIIRVPVNASDNCNSLFMHNYLKNIYFNKKRPVKRKVCSEYFHFFFINEQDCPTYLRFSWRMFDSICFYSYICWQDSNLECMIQ